MAEEREGGDRSSGWRQEEEEGGESRMSISVGFRIEEDENVVGPDCGRLVSLLSCSFCSLSLTEVGRETRGFVRGREDFDPAPISGGTEYNCWLCLYSPLERLPLELDGMEEQPMETVVVPLAAP